MTRLMIRPSRWTRAAGSGLRNHCAGARSSKRWLPGCGCNGVYVRGLRKADARSVPPQGVELATMEALVRYWGTGYDLRRIEESRREAYERSAFAAIRT